MTGNPNGFSWNKHFNRNVQEASCAPKWGGIPSGGNIQSGVDPALIGPSSLMPAGDPSVYRA